MKKKLLGLLCACFLLSGCVTGSPQETQTAPPTTKSTSAASQLPLLEQGIVPAESGNLRYIPNEAVETMVSPEMRLLGNGLLLSGYSHNTLVLKHISLEDGALVSEAAVSAGEGTKLYIGSGEIALCDRESGLISVLDEAFRLRRSYELPREGDAWYLNSELDTLYVIFFDRGVMVRQLETGEMHWLVDGLFQVTVQGTGPGCLILKYTDRQDQKTYTRYLDLSGETLNTMPIASPISGGARQGDTWLLHSGQEEGRHFLVKGDNAYCFAWTESTVKLLPHRRHLLVTDASGRNLTLYGNDGAFLSRCSLPQNSSAVTGSDFVWSGYWEGYFFTDFVDSACRLMFWDVAAEIEGEALDMQPFEQVQQTQPVLEPQLYQRAEELSRRFGVDIRIGEQCATEYSHYATYPLTDPVWIRAALDTLEETLAQYPEGFFRQLAHGSIETIRLELVGALTIKNEEDTHPDSVGAFAQNMGSYYLVALDGFLLQKSTIYHEIAHIIDSKLEWDALLREDALFSRDAWLALQPEGFRYAMTYREIPQEVLAFSDSGYFVYDYALTFPTEDRAVLMEAAMQNFSWDFEPGSGRRAKLKYYADCIRDCFDTEGWPEITLWEQVLQ